MWWESCATTHCGFWNNLDAERGTRSTLTLPTQWGLILIAFLALFIRLSGGYLWSIICFVIHQSHASTANQDDAYHQIQLALRNTDTEASLGWKLFNVWSARKNSRARVFNRTYWLIILAMIHTSGIGVLGGLSSRFIAGSDEALAVAGKCGWMEEVVSPKQEINEPGKFDIFSGLVVAARYGYRRSASYARSCYAQTSDNSSNACEIYTRTTLPYSISLEASCPFDDSVCNGSAIKLDTGAIRSDLDLGINTGPESAVTLHQAMSCAPVAGDKFSTGWRTVQELNKTVDTIVVETGLNTTVSENEKVQCWKLGTESPERMDMMSCLTETSLAYGNTAYDISSTSAFVNYQGDYAPRFVPIPELASNDSDITLISLINRITYRSEITDPWFRANESSQTRIFSIKGWRAARGRTFLGCRQQYQLCLLDGSYCSPQTGVYGIPHSDEELAHLQPAQRAVFQLMWKMAWFSQLNFQLIFIGRENLIANDYLWDGGSQFGVSAALPPNHWQSEVLNWFNVSLASLQRAAPAFARPPDFDLGTSSSSTVGNDSDSAPASNSNSSTRRRRDETGAEAKTGNSILDFIVPPSSPSMQHLCHHIKIRSKAHTSFSVLGLFLLIGLGLLVIAVAAVLPQGVAAWQVRTGRGAYKRLEWVESNMFQLQRMAAEGRGVGPWVGREGYMPVLREGGVFNLTGMSLGGRVGGGGGGGQAWGGSVGLTTGAKGYQAVRSGEEIEMVGRGSEEDKKGSLARLVGK